MEQKKEEYNCLDSCQARERSTVLLWRPSYFGACLTLALNVIGAKSVNIRVIWLKLYIFISDVLSIDGKKPH
uniref:Uncharacterized protein n=1 Tax=Romanomermis culicivorax TaxID=13658 RepID=A0A915KF75_ROMCU